MDRVAALAAAASEEASSSSMLPDSVIDGRFEVNALAGAGGMGTVYRARDRSSGATVALKLLREADAHSAARFVHEAHVLSGLDHPHIVRYVTHGTAPSGQPYLVMEWLAGETLSERLLRGALRLEEALAVVRAAAGALGTAHARGIVHRDVKPSNLFLVDGSIERVKVLDFGIARLHAAATRLTQTGNVLGTPGYMAPEQARGDDARLDARADVFSLGCVLFECLTGLPAFHGQHVMALLAKLLMEEPPRLRELRPEMPAELDHLVARMLAKEPAARPGEGAAVAQLLDGIRDASGGATPADRSVAPITGDEKRLISIVAIQPVRERPSPLQETVPLNAVSLDALAQVRCVAAPLGARVEQLCDGTVVATVTGAGSATDVASLAARCALRIHATLPTGAWNVVLVTGRAEDTGRIPLGEVLERAASLFEAPSRAGRADGREERREGVQIDTITMALLDMRFDVLEQGGALWLLAEREVGEAARKLLGRPSPYVGRDRELRGLLQTVEGSFEDRQAAVALVTAAAGMGKSRLRHELQELLKRRYPAMDLGVGRGDSIGAGSAFAMLAGALRNALGIAAGEAAPAVREKLERAAGRLLAEADRSRVAAFLGELIGAPFPDDDRPLLRAARQSPALMAERIEQAYIDHARAVTDAQPMLVVLEDLHWGDAPSVRIFDRALRELCDRPFVVVAFARPEVHDLFPRLWMDRGRSEIQLRPLPARAAEHLVRSALGEAIEAQTVAAIVAQADGNAFYLEELIRAVAEGRAGALPETVLGMVEARLATLGSEERRLLRAASVFGEVCWTEGVRALSGAPTPGARKEEAWAELFEREILERRPTPCFASQETIAFRHALLREGAYAMLTDRDRRLGHRLAGEWLLQAGEQDPMVLAEHFERGGETARAAGFYLQAAVKARLAADVPAVLARARRGIACEPAGEVLAELHILLSELLFHLDDLAQSCAHALAALESSSPGSEHHGNALAIALLGAVYAGDRQAARDLLQRAPPADLPVDPRRVLVTWTPITFHAVLWEGMPDLARRYLHRIEQDVPPIAGDDHIAWAAIDMVRAWWCAHAERDAWGALQRCRTAKEHIEALGDRFHVMMVRLYAAQNELRLGAFELAEQAFDALLAVEHAPAYVALTALSFRIMGLLEQRRVTEAQEQAGTMLRRASASSGFSYTTQARLLLSECRLERGDLAGAEEEVRAVGDAARLVPCFQSVRLSLLAEIRLRQGRAAEAAALAREAFALERSTACLFVLRQEVVPALLAEALHESGEVEAAREVLREARAELLARADKIADPAYRRSFLEDIDAHVRTLALARAWLETRADGGGATR
ncbi:protein kinase [Sorangium sp. So ce448]|uniref:serine/threonine-protein kinase n=1 Tax=Sorangium sp. So ce448 TaxID=3133314 RepID=UPI003F5FD9AC